MNLSALKKTLKKLNNDLRDKPDEKLIDGYKAAMQDYKDTDNKECKAAADIIKKELTRRNIEI